MFETMSLVPYSHYAPYILAALYVYFFPTFVALVMNNRNIGSILFANFTLAWSIAGWFGVLVWAFDA